MLPGHLPGDQPDFLLASAADDGRDLLATATSDWDRRIPDCPAWNAADLVGHMGSILAWMATIITTGRAVARTDREPPPAGRSTLSAWYEGHLARTLAIMRQADPSAPAWTFSSRGDHRVGWWHRRLAVEIAIHRWDILYATAASTEVPPESIDGLVAAAGIGEFLTEFLPGLLENADPRVREGLRGTLHLDPADQHGGPGPWRFDLDARTLTTADHSPADTAIRGSCSDLLLWLTNRHPSPGPEIFGRADVARAWLQLQR
jgi:uncharacterized protein (TIGR03083 family)